MKCYEDLMWRGLIQDISSPELIDKLNEGRLITLNSFFVH